MPSLLMSDCFGLLTVGQLSSTFAMESESESVFVLAFTPEFESPHAVLNKVHNIRAAKRLIEYEENIF